MQVEIVVMQKQEAGDWIHRNMNMASMATAILFGGDRFSFIDEAVGVKVDGVVVGIATIAPEGEMLGDKPTIVGCFVKSEFRDQGLGKRLMQAAVDRMLERNLQHPYRVDATSTPGLRIAQGCGRDDLLEILDATMGGASDSMFLNS